MKWNRIRLLTVLYRRFFRDFSARYLFALKKKVFFLLRNDFFLRRRFSMSSSAGNHWPWTQQKLQALSTWHTRKSSSLFLQDRRCSSWRLPFASNIKSTMESDADEGAHNACRWAWVGSGRVNVYITYLLIFTCNSIRTAYANDIAIKRDWTL